MKEILEQYPHIEQLLKNPIWSFVQGIDESTYADLQTVIIQLLEVYEIGTEHESITKFADEYNRKMEKNLKNNFAHTLLVAEAYGHQNMDLDRERLLHNAKQIEKDFQLWHETYQQTYSEIINKMTAYQAITSLSDEQKIYLLAIQEFVKKHFTYVRGAPFAEVLKNKIFDCDK